MFRRITSRWFFNSFAVILATLLVVGLAVGFGVRWFYYDSVYQLLDSRMGVVGNLLQSYAADPSADFFAQVRTLVENFELRDRMELMALDANGEVIVTSSGFSITDPLEMPDFTEALASSQGRGSFRGQLAGESICALTALSPVADEQIVALRLIVSMARIDRVIWQLWGLTAGVGAAIVFFVIVSSAYFIRSIIIPIGEVGTTARRIAQGDFSIRLEKQNEDEIGELCDTINEMAVALAGAEKLKNDFISSVSHELRTPLTAIRGWGETLSADGGADPALLRRGMKVILDESDRLSTMVEELLDFSRMQSGRLSLVMGRIDLFAELDEAVIMYAEKARREGVTLSCELPELPAPVNGDRNRLRQVFINIIDNAIKYSDSGGSVEVSAELTPTEAIVTVRDHGCGIAPADLPRIKEKFFKANSTRRGSGIGLAVADELITQHAGSLEVSSALGEGTTVVIRLPLYKV